MPCFHFAARLLGVALCLAPIAPRAQTATLTGRITDAETGEPVVSATVYLPASGHGAAADLDGRYRLAVATPGALRVVVSSVGYSTRTQTVTLAPGTTTYDVALAPSIVETPEVTVTARARASDVLSTPQSIGVVDAALLDRSSGGTPLEALDELAGVRLLRTGPGIAKPVVRGLTAQRVLVVNDGVRQEGQGWGDEHGPEIGAADVDRIEVVRGPASLLYGSDALGGVVQTLQNDLFAGDAPIAGEARVSGLTVSQQGEGSLRLGGTSGGWGYEARGGLLRGGLVRTPDGLIPNTAMETATLGGRVGRRLGARGQVGLEASAFRQRLGLFEPDEAAPPAGRYAIDAPNQRVDHDRLAATLDLPLGEAGTRLDAIAAVQQNRRREFEEGTDPDLFLRLTTVTADARLHHRPVGRLFGTIGASGLVQRNETLAEETLIPAGTTLNGALYLAEQAVFSALTVDAGARVDVRSLDVEAAPDLGVTAQTRSYAALTGAVGAAWQARPDLSISANLGRAFRAPTLQELFGNGVHEGTLRFERGNAGLTPETSLALDAVVRYLSPHVYAEASAFLNAVDGYITPTPTDAADPESGFTIYDFVQTDARLTGVEARLDLHPHALHGLGLHLAGDVTRGVERATGTPLPFVPPARLQTAVEVQLEQLGRVEDIEVRFGPTFVTAQRRPEVPDEIPTDAYTTWDASLSGRLRMGATTVTPTLSVDNLTDASFVDPMSRYRPFGIQAPGRSVRLAVRVAF